MWRAPFGFAKSLVSLVYLVSLVVQTEATDDPALRYPDIPTARCPDGPPPFRVRAGKPGGAPGPRKSPDLPPGEIPERFCGPTRFGKTLFPEWCTLVLEVAYVTWHLDILL